MADSSPIPGGPFPDSYWVLPGRLLAGEYPADSGEPATRRKLDALLRAGITSFVDLTRPGELPPYDGWLREEATDYGLTVEHVRFAIPDFGTPDAALMNAILDHIDARLSAGQAVYVHCRGGIGRTGSTVGCFLARRGLPTGQRLTELARLRAACPSAIWPSPETPDQRDFVLGWEQGQSSERTRSDP